MMALAVVALTFGSSILVADVGTMPGRLQAWVRVNPLSDLADACRGLLLGGPVAAHALPVLAWAAGITVVAFPLALRAYRRKAR
jgi:oleandomycin transport system permease protein